MSWDVPMGSEWAVVVELTPQHLTFLLVGWFLSLVTSPEDSSSQAIALLGPDTLHQSWAEEGRVYLTGVIRVQKLL